MKRFLSRHNWKGLFGLLRTAAEPVEVASRLYRKTGAYPYALRLRTPVGPIGLTLHSHDDLITVHEIFFRGDYATPGRAGRVRHMVDFGANIGVASAYFASRDDGVTVHAYEPVPRNIGRARANLVQFGSRVQLAECAVGTEAGVVAFGVEPTGRYGGIGLDHAEQITVPCRTGSGELQGIIAATGSVDVLKLDIEDMELPLLRSLPASTLDAIGRIFAECDGHAVTLPGFRFRQVLSVANFFR